MLCLSFGSSAQQAPIAPPPAREEPKTPPPSAAGGEKDKAPAEPKSGAGAAVDSNKYKIGPSDILSIRVWNEEKFSGPVAVHQDGKITLPLVGDVDAGGLTPVEVQDTVTKALTKYVVKPLVTITVQEVGSKRYFLDGQVNHPGEFPLGVPTTILEAISRAGGLVDIQANPAAVFLYRGESRDVATAMGIDCTPYEGPVIPVIYTINLRDPAGYFLASSFEMRNKDILYVSNSFAVESTKFITYLNTINTAIQTPIATVTSAYGLRNIVAGTGAVPTIVTTGTTTVVTPTATP